MSKNNNSGEIDVDITLALEASRLEYEEKTKKEIDSAKKNAKADKLFKKQENILKSKGIESFKVKITDGSIEDNTKVFLKSENNKNEEIKDYIDRSKNNTEIENRGDVFSISDLLKNIKK